MAGDHRVTDYRIWDERCATSSPLSLVSEGHGTRGRGAAAQGFTDIGEAHSPVAVSPTTFGPDPESPN
jgi:hypothetical protein